MQNAFEDNYFSNRSSCLAFTNLTAQNGWVRTKSSYYAQAAASLFSSSDYYSLDGDLNLNGNTFTNYALSMYGEYGITNNITLIGNIPILKINQFDVTEPALGIGDIRIGAKYKLLAQIPTTLALETEIPTGDGILFTDSKSPNALGIIEQINLPTSDGEWNFLVTLATSMSSSNGKTFGSLFGTINLRTESFSHQYKSGAEIGHYLFDRLWLIGKLQINGTLSDSPNKAVSFLYGEGTTYTAFGATAIYQLNEQLGLVFSYFDYEDFLLKRKNIYDGATFSIGVSIEK
ncbi:MAG: hypothetical protein HC892_13470 [Saprospiraceae bacterium]|nr:hypothetical protein [Saprospiraceae bacterium]